MLIKVDHLDWRLCPRFSIKTLSRDAFADERLGLVYAAQTSIDSSTIMVDAFLSPVLKFKDESVRSAD